MSHGPRRIRVHRKGFHRKGYRREGFTEHRDGHVIHIRSTRVSGGYVPAANFMEKDQGEEGHGPRKIKITHKGSLEGWHHTQEAETRRMHIREAVERHGYAKTIRKLNALHVLSKHTDPIVSRTAEEDMHWLEREH